MKINLSKIINTPRGFTLIELMVVISIIAFLAVIGIAAFSNAQRTARDGRRRADIEAIATAMESKFDPINGVYTIASIDTFFSSGIQPKDPSSNTPYQLQLISGGKGFWVCSQSLEVPGNGNATVVGTGTTYPTYSPTNVGNYYCKSSQQSK